MKNTMTVILACTTLVAFGQWGKQINGNGKTTTIERSVGEYDAVASAGWFDVVLVSGQEGELTLEGESNLLEYIKTEVKDGRLVIKTKKGVSLKPSNWKKGITITVPVEEIESVSLSGSGDVVSKTLLKADDFSTAVAGSGDVALQVEADQLKATLSGSGDIELEGKTGFFEVSVAGSGDVKAYDLIAESVEARVSGSADIKVTANKSLTARVSGSGDITYKGNPGKIDTKSSGSGDISSY